MTQKNRLQSGGRIDRTRPLPFEYNGKGYTGFAGDTLASPCLPMASTWWGAVSSTAGPVAS